MPARKIGHPVKLSKNTPCQLFEINAPIWNGGARKVGLAKFRISKHNEIRFKYRRKDGSLSIPDAYYFDGNRLNTERFTSQFVRGLELVLIPFSELEILERIEPEVIKLEVEVKFNQGRLL